MNDSHLKVIQCLNEIDKEKNIYTLYYKFEIITKRNDKWLVAHPRFLLVSWQGNIDLQVIFDNGKVDNYLTKYVTKPEISMTKGIAAMIRNILKGTIEDGLSVQAALKRSMAKLLGERMMCKQEKSHLILSLPMVSCSHQFCKVYLDDDLNLIDLEEKKHD